MPRPGTWAYSIVIFDHACTQASEIDSYLDRISISLSFGVFLYSVVRRIEIVLDTVALPRIHEATVEGLGFFCCVADL